MYKYGSFYFKFYVYFIQDHFVFFYPYPKLFKDAAFRQIRGFYAALLIKQKKRSFDAA